MTQQDIAPDQSLNKILDEITNIWIITFQYTNINNDENIQKKLAIQNQQQELEDKFLEVYQTKLLEITDFPQKEKLVDDFILKIDELKISIQGSSMEYPDSESINFRESVCDSIKNELLQKKEELKKEKLEAMNKKTELLLSKFLVHSQAKKDPLKTLLQSIIKPWKVEFFPTEFSQDKEDMLVENFIKDKKFRFLQDIKTLILDFSKDEISQTISLFQNSKNLLSSFYSQGSQEYKIRNNLVSDILQILRESGKTVEIIPELEETPENILTSKEEFPSSEIDISKPFQNYIDLIIKSNNESFLDQENLKKSPYSFVFGYLEELTDDNFRDKNSNYFKMCLFYYSALTLSQSLKGENQDGSPSQDQLVSDLCMSFDQFNNELTDQEKEIFLRSVIENFSITDINRLIDKFQQELTKSNENKQQLTTYPRNQEKLENILARLKYFKEYLEREVEAELNVVFKIFSKKIINLQSSINQDSDDDKKDFIKCLNLIIIEDPNTKAQLNKNFTLEDLHFLRLNCLISGILNTQNTEKLNSIIVNKIEDFLLHPSQGSILQGLENQYLKFFLENDQIMDKFVEKLKANKELNSKTLSIASTNSFENPNSLKDNTLKTILLEAIRRKHSPHNKPNLSITSANSLPASLKTTQGHLQ